jgi:CubicO group peptidase (beta-lactamase class C family)
MTRSLVLAAPEEVGCLSTRQLERISAALRQQVEQRRVPGITALVARRGKVAYFETFGVRDPALIQPMTKDAIFRIYSMTKPVVSVAAMMLFQEGRLLREAGTRTYARRAIIIFLIWAIALAGFRFFGQVRVQFMMVWQR